MGLERPIILSGTDKKEEPLIKITGGDFEPERISGRAEVRTEPSGRKKEKAKKENEEPKMGGGGLEQPIILSDIEKGSVEEPLIKITGGDFEPEKTATHAKPFTESLKPKKVVENDPDGELRTALDKGEEAYDSLMRDRNVLKRTGKLRGTRNIAMETAERIIARDKKKAASAEAPTERKETPKAGRYDIEDSLYVRARTPVESQEKEVPANLPGQDNPDPLAEYGPIVHLDPHAEYGPVIHPSDEDAKSKAGRKPTVLGDPYTEYGPEVGPGTTVKEASSATPPTAEEQERKKAELKALREALVRLEQDDLERFKGADSGEYREKLDTAIEAYDKARSEFIDGDIGRYAQEQFELMRTRGQGDPSKFEKFTETADKFKRRHPILTGVVSVGLLGLGFVFPPAWGARQVFSGTGTFVGSYELMRRASLNGVFGRIGGIKKEMLKGDLSKLSVEEVEGRMAALAAYARVQGYWDDVKGPYEELHKAYVGKLGRNLPPEVVNAYASKEIEASRQAFEERREKEDAKKQGRWAAAIGLGALTGGLFGKLFGGGGEKSPVSGTGSGAPPSPGMLPAPKVPIYQGVDSAPWLGTDVPLDSAPTGVDSAPWLGTDVPLDTAPTPSPETPLPSPEVLQKVMEFFPANHGLRPEYYDLIKGESAEKFLGRKHFATSFDRQYPWPKVDLDPGNPQPQTRISFTRMMDYSRLQDRMRAALAQLSPDQVESAKKLPVSEFLKQVMGTVKEVPAGGVGGSSGSL